MKNFWGVIAALVLVAAFAWSQSVVNQGAPGKQGPWPVVISGGAGGGGAASSINTFPGICSNSSAETNTVVGGTATAVPSQIVAGSGHYVVICNSAQNTSTAVVKCRQDGIAPVFAAGNPGQVLLVGDCFLSTEAHNVQCIADAAGRNVTSYECVP